GRLAAGPDERWGVHGPTVVGPTAGANVVVGGRSARPAPARSRAHLGEGDRPASSIVGPMDEYESTRRSSPAGEAPNPSSLTAPLSGGARRRSCPCFPSPWAISTRPRTESGETCVHHGSAGTESAPPRPHARRAERWRRPWRRPAAARCRRAPSRRRLAPAGRRLWRRCGPARSGGAEEEARQGHV